MARRPKRPQDLELRNLPLHLCRQIATASKHSIVSVHPDPKVGAAVRAGEPIQVSGPVFFNAWEAVDVFEAAERYWTPFIYGNRIASRDPDERDNHAHP